jgi:DNA gyrase/topoisomerase IV subunit B
MKEKKIEYTPETTYHIDPTEHIRLRPQRYFKALFEEKTLDLLALEIIQYAIDQNSTAITVNLHADSFSVEFNIGMSLEVYHDYFGDITQTEAILVKITRFPELWKKDVLESGLRGSVGLIRINAASEWCKLLTYLNGQKGVFLFKEGKTETRSVTKSDENKNYTKLTVKPDATIFPNLTINPETLQQKINTVSKKLDGFDIQLHIVN